MKGCADSVSGRVVKILARFRPRACGRLERERISKTRSGRSSCALSRTLRASGPGFKGVQQFCVFVILKTTGNLACSDRPERSAAVDHLPLASTVMSTGSL